MPAVLFRVEAAGGRDANKVSYRAITRRNCTRKMLDFGHVEVSHVSEFLTLDCPLRHI